MFIEIESKTDEPGPKVGRKQSGYAYEVTLPLCREHLQFWACAHLN
jgi:hypothetical protein